MATSFDTNIKKDVSMSKDRASSFSKVVKEVLYSKKFPYGIRIEKVKKGQNNSRLFNEKLNSLDKGKSSNIFIKLEFDTESNKINVKTRRDTNGAVKQNLNNDIFPLDNLHQDYRNVFKLINFYENFSKYDATVSETDVEKKLKTIEYSANNDLNTFSKSETNLFKRSFEFKNLLIYFKELECKY